MEVVKVGEPPSRHEVGPTNLQIYNLLQDYVKVHFTVELLVWIYMESGLRILWLRYKNFSSGAGMDRLQKLRFFHVQLHKLINKLTFDKLKSIFY